MISTFSSELNCCFSMSLGKFYDETMCSKNRMNYSGSGAQTGDRVTSVGDHEWEDIIVGVGYVACLELARLLPGVSLEVPRAVPFQTHAADIGLA